MGNKILVGSQTTPTATFEPGQIYEVSGYFSSALIGDTLNVDTLTPTVGNAIVIEYGDFIPDGSDGMTTADGATFRAKGQRSEAAGQFFPAGTPLWWYSDNVLKGKFYAQSTKRIGTAQYQISAVSAIGLLDRQQHNGGMYDGAEMDAVLGEIIGGRFPYTVDAAVAEQRVFGWLPADSARNSLHKLLLAYGVNVTKDANGDPVFRFVAAGTAAAVPDGRIFLGGSVTVGDTVARVEVTEHTFVALESGETVTAFDNTDGGGYAEHRRVVFRDAPLFGLAASGNLEIEESNCNYAVVTGIGTVTGKKYAHVTAPIGKDNPAATGSRTLDVKENTLVSPLNSYNLLERLYDYATLAETVSADFKIENELPNQQIAFTDAFGDAKTAWLKTMQFRASSFLRAKAELITGYTPGHYGNNYSHVRLVTEDITGMLLGLSGRVRIVLIQGGSGGQGGGQGGYGLGDSQSWGGTMIHTSTTEDEAYSHAPGSQAYTQQPAPGGKPGAAGEGGKIYVRELDVTANMLWTVRVGTGGVGGAAHVATSIGDVEPGEPGTPGTHTTLTVGGVVYSSEAGVQSPSGIKDLLSGTIYAARGADGYKGGDGGLGTATDDYGVSGNGGAGESVAGYSGGSGGEGLTHARSSKENGTAGGGGGGGAAYGANGGSGENAMFEAVRHGSGSTADWHDDYYGGGGGRGANALPPPNANYGTGGGGGNGGGGAGNSGGARIPYPNRSGVIEYAYPGNLSGGVVLGGSGSRGGNGGAGIALIYWG